MHTIKVQKFWEGHKNLEKCPTLLQKKWEISSNFVASSENLNFTYFEVHIYSSFFKHQIRKYLILLFLSSIIKFGINTWCNFVHKVKSNVLIIISSEVQFGF